MQHEYIEFFKSRQKFRQEWDTLSSGTTNQPEEMNESKKGVWDANGIDI